MTRPRRSRASCFPTPTGRECWSRGPRRAWGSGGAAGRAGHRPGALRAGRRAARQRERQPAACRKARRAGCCSQGQGRDRRRDRAEAGESADAAAIVRTSLLRVLVGEPLAQRAGRLRASDGRSEALSAYLCVMRSRPSRTWRCRTTSWVACSTERGAYDEAQSELGLALGGAAPPDERFRYQAQLLRGQAALLAGRATEATQFFQELLATARRVPSTLEAQDMLERAQRWDGCRFPVSSAGRWGAHLPQTAQLSFLLPKPQPPQVGKLTEAADPLSAADAVVFLVAKAVVAAQAGRNALAADPLSAADAVVFLLPKPQLLHSRAS